MTNATLDQVIRPLARRLDRDKMAALGIETTMKVAHSYNRWQWGRCEDHRRALFAERFEELLAGNDSSRAPHAKITDGFLLDTTHSLPHLDELLEEGDRVIAEHARRNKADDRYRAFFRNIVPPQNLHRYPALLKFITSSAVLEIVARYLGYIPCLSSWVPEGVRFVESGMEFDAQAHLPPRDSQLYHIDPYCSPMVYVIVLLRDTAMENGPFTWMGAAASDAVKKATGYWRKGHGYRLTDDQVYAVVGQEPEHRLIYPAGTVLFCDTSRCLHFGSRHAVKPRYQMMYGLMSPCRCDFTDSLTQRYAYPASDADSALRRLVLNKEYQCP